jgi:UDP-N-acetylmuramoyl-L-alanyl-D-glutamate--2,6-diaminopimelate ligase
MNFLKNIYHLSLAFLGNVVYGFPSRKIFVIGVTGTKGKSTVVELMSAILEAAGIASSFVSSVRIKIGDDVQPNKTGNSMPGRFFLQKFLRDAVRAGSRYAIIETTSQGVAQYRHRFIDFDMAMFLNLHPEHLEAHGSFERYRDAKVRFFSDVARRSAKSKKFFFINRADDAREHFFEAVLNFGAIHYFSRENFVETKLARGKESIGDWFENNFNLENAAAAAKFAEVVAGVEWGVIKEALRAFKGVPGRMEIVREKPFRAVVDYAHTPDSLEKVYRALQPKSSRNKLICVLGSAGGGRDTWKRPVFGGIAAKYCSEVFITNEDPYDESPEAIMQSIAEGFQSANGDARRLHRVGDRKEAIRSALGTAKKGDVVVVTGKGSETWIHEAGGKKAPWSDRGTIEEILKSSNG